MTLRVQLLLVSLVVLALPLAGWQFIREMEQFLRQGQGRALIATARSIALQLAPYYPQRSDSRALYVRLINYPIELDGYTSDWTLWLPWAQHFGTGQPAPVTVALANDSEFVYLLFQVRDASRNYYRPDEILSRADHIVLTLGRTHESLRFEITTAAPGAFEARPVNRPSALRLRGEWQETTAGYSVELRLTAQAMADSLGFAVWDSGNANPLASTGTAQTPAAPLPLVRPSPDLTQRLAALLSEQRAAWLVDPSGWVLARHGNEQSVESVSTDAPSGAWGAFVYRYLLASPLSEPRTRSEIAVRLDSEEVRSALAGKPAVRWQPASLEDTIIASAAVPVWLGNDVAGALVLEQASDALLLFTNSALLRLVGLTLIVFIASALVLLGFASLLSWRVLKLRADAERSITAEGRPRGSFPAPRAKDEIGDLGRSFARVLDELKDHTDYLRTLADKLSHELRTPLAMVRSSLDNLEQETLTAYAADYTRRARQGTDRLSEILRAMGEAARTEQSIQQAEVEDFDLAELVRNSVDNWCQLGTNRRLAYCGPDHTLPFHGAPELLARLLDKLLENAVDFTPPQGRIQVELTQRGDSYRLAVINEGPSLPEGSERRLFESLVSMRARKDNTPHLGLGLYIARLIAEFHGSHIHADNVSGGVRFEVSLSKMVAHPCTTRKL